MNPRLLTYRQAADICGVCPKTLKRAAGDDVPTLKRLRVVKFGYHTVRISPHELEDWKQRHEARRETARHRRRV